MAGFNHKKKLSKGIIRAEYGLVWFFLFIIAAFLNSCGTTKPAGEEIPIKVPKSITHQWNDIFDYHGTVPFNFGDSDEQIYTISVLCINSKGEYIVLDGKAKKILYFDADAKFKKYISRQGEGPGEYLFISDLFLDNDDNLYIYDVSKRIITQLSAYDYRFKKQTRLPDSINSSIVTKNECLITYRLFSEGKDVLFKLSPQLEIIKTAFEPKDERVHRFVARFRLGDLRKVTDDRFIFLFPEEYKFYIYDFDLNLIKILYSPNSSEFMPPIIEMPDGLSPFDYSKKHAKWWGKVLRPTSVEYIGDGYFLGLLLKFKNMSGDWFVNVHDLDGNTYGLGLKIPYEGTIRGANGGIIYVVEDASFDEENKLKPLRLHRYRIKKLK